MSKMELSLSIRIRSLTARLSRVRSEVIWVFAGQVLVFAGGFASIKILTSLLGPAEYGQLSLGLTIAGLLHMFVYGPIEQVVLRFVSVYSERQEIGIFFSTIKQTHSLVAKFLILLAIVAMVLTDVTAGREWAWLVVTASLFGIVSGLNATFVSLQNALRDRKIVALHQGADVWLRLGLAIGALYFFRQTGYAALLGFLFGTLCITLSQRAFALRNHLVRDNWNCEDRASAANQKLRQEFFEYGKPFILFALFGTLSAYADRWIILFSLGEEAVGGYAAIYQVANAPIALFVGMTNQLVVPVIFERAGALATVSQVSSSTKLLYQTVLLYGGVMLAFTTIAYFCAEPFVRILTTPEFVTYHSLLWVLTLGLALANIGQLLVMKGLSHKQTKGYVAPKFLQSFSFLILAFVLVKFFGVAGVASALCLSSLVYLIAVLCVNRYVRFVP